MAKKDKKDKKDKKSKGSKGTGPKGEKLANNRFRTPPFIASYADGVFEARETLSGDMKFQLSMIFPENTDWSLMDEIIEEVAAKKFGSDKKKWPKNFKSPKRSGNDDKDGAGPYKDTFFMNGSSKRKPGLIDKEKNQLYDSDDFYSGCLARATISIFAFDKGGGKGVGIGLQNVQKLDDGEPIDGRVPAEDDF